MLQVFPAHKAIYNENMADLKNGIQSFLGPPLMIILSGLILFCTGVGLAYRHYSVIQNGLMIEGQVIELDKRCDSDGCTYRPIVEFTTMEGQNFTYESPSYTHPPAYDVGETVTIYYLEENPDDARIKNEGIVFHLIFIIGGATAVVIGFVKFTDELRANK